MRIFSIIILFALLSCERQKAPHPVFDFYPPVGVFEEGYVGKFYYHYYPNDPNSTSATEIRYIKYLKLNDNQYETETYNAGFELSNKRSYLLSADTVFLESGFGIRRTDTIPLNLINNITATWGGNFVEPYKIKYENRDKNYIYTEYQKSVYDSLIDNRPAKVFFNEWHYQEEGEDSLFNQGHSKTYYVSDIGYFGEDSYGSSYRRQMELIEQMSFEEFEKRANHGQHRIGYIDPTQTISDDEDFEICGHEERIMDYYNLQPNAEYKGGKGLLRKIVNEQLDPSKLAGQSGMLTFRFVINCNGEAGRFVTNGVDFDFQKKEFSQEAIDHLLSILQGLDSWQNLETKEGEAKDAYAYITFKINDEEIIDILP